MSVLIRIPTPLRKFTDDLSVVEVSSGTVQDAIDALLAKYPGLQSQIVGDDGKVRRFVNVYVNDEDIRFLEKFDTELEDEDEVSIIPAIAGGK